MKVIVNDLWPSRIETEASIKIYNQTLMLQILQPDLFQTLDARCCSALV